MKSIKLNTLESQSLCNKEMNNVRGGEEECTCGCGCLYQNNGGSSTNSNAEANKSEGKFSEANYRIFCGEWKDFCGAPRNSDCD